MVHHRRPAKTAETDILATLGREGKESSLADSQTGQPWLVDRYTFEILATGVPAALAFGSRWSATVERIEIARSPLAGIFSTLTVTSTFP